MVAASRLCMFVCVCVVVVVVAPYLGLKTVAARRLCVCVCMCACSGGCTMFRVENSGIEPLPRDPVCLDEWFDGHVYIHIHKKNTCAYLRVTCVGMICLIICQHIIDQRRHKVIDNALHVVAFLHGCFN